MTTESTSVPATEGQFKQMRRLVEDAAEKAARQLGLDKDAMQRLVEFGVVGLVPHLVTLFTNLVVTDEFADEEVPSTYGYLSGYEHAKAAAEQLATLKALFPQLESYDATLAAKDALPGSEGNFLIPDWRVIAPTYGEAVAAVFTKLSETRNGAFYNYWDDQLGSEYLKEGTKKAGAFQKLREEQKEHNVLVVQAQFGIRHRGRSVQRARVVMGSSEFGLGAFEIGCMLLTHPDRLANYDDLWIDAAGDEFAPDADGVFSSAPYFYFDDGKLEFYSDDVDYPDGNFGAASAFVVSVPSE